MSAKALERFSEADWAGVSALLVQWPFKPFRGHARWKDENDLRALCVSRAGKLILNPQTVTWVERSAGDVAGFATLSRLSWDTEQLGMGAARLDFLVAGGRYADQLSTKLALLVAVADFCLEKGIIHLSARVDTSDLSGIHALEEAGFIAVDGILTFARELGDFSWSPAGGPRVRLATVEDREAVAELAGRSFIYDRFHSDPAIPAEKADALHAAWLRNSCGGPAADAVIIAEDGAGLAGFVSCKLQRDTPEFLGVLIGTIVLVATSGGSRGKGVGREATFATMDWMRRQGAGLVEVGTQMRNIPASRLYEGCGFRLAGGSVSMRRYFGPGKGGEMR